MCFLHNSIKNTDENNPTCEGGSPMEVPGEFDNDVSVIYTYSVTFEVGHHSIVLYEYLYVTNTKQYVCACDGF